MRVKLGRRPPVPDAVPAVAVIRMEHQMRTLRPTYVSLLFALLGACAASAVLPRDPLEARIERAVDRLIARDRERIELLAGGAAGQDIVREDLLLCVDPTTSRCDVVCRLEAESEGDSLRLLLGTAFDVTSVTDSDGDSLSHSRSNELLIVSLGPESDAGPVELLLHYGLSRSSRDVVFGSEGLAVMKGSSLWYPSSERPDAFPLDMEVRYPLGYSSVASGVLSGMAPSSDDDTCPNGDLWQVPSEVRGAMLAVGRFESTLKVSGGVFVGLHRLVDERTEPGDGRASGIPASVSYELSQLLRYLEACYGPYPFDWLSVLAVPRASAMWEPAEGGPGLVVIPLPEAGGGTELGSILVSRLVAPLAECWWKHSVLSCPMVYQGLAQQAEIDWLEAAGHEEAASQLSDFNHQRLVQALQRRGSRVSLADCIGAQPSGDRSVCGGKGAAVFGLLRELIGAESYCSALRSEAEEHAGRPLGIGALMSAFERESRQDLDWFFYEWVSREDLPTYVLEHESERIADGSYAVRGTIIQPGEFYRTPLPLTIDLGGWSYEEVVPIEASRQRFVLQTESEPVAITIDARETIPRIEASERATAHYGRGSLASASGRWEDAADELGAASLLDPDNAAYAHDYGKALVRLGRVKVGTRHMERAIDLEPGNADYRSSLAALHLRRGEFASALPHLDVLVSARPDDPESRIDRATALVGVGRLDEAAAVLEAAAGLAGGALESKLFIATGFLLEARGEIKAAVRLYEAALAADPVSDEARRRLREITERDRRGQR